MCLTKFFLSAYSNENVANGAKIGDRSDMVLANPYVRKGTTMDGTMPNRASYSGARRYVRRGDFYFDYVHIEM